MKEFILQNYELLILVGACILDVVLFIFGVLKRKKCSNEPLEYVLTSLPVVVSEVESKYGAGNGPLKLVSALDVALDIYKKLTGIRLSRDCDIAKEIVRHIELILSTPQKKG